MSWDIPSCERCGCPTLFEVARPFGGGCAYAVAWLCPKCKSRSLDICPVGPDIPGPGVCLNCGAECLTGPCGACGVNRTEIESRIAEVSAGYPSLLQSAAVSGMRGLIRLAFNMLDIRLSSEPLDAAAWEAKGSLFDRVGLAALRVIPLERALQAGASAAVEFSLGCALAAEQRHQDAADAFQRYLDQQPDGEHVCAALSNLGSSLAELGQFAAAEKAHRRAIKRDPSCLRLRLNYYETLRRRRYFDEALEVLNDALRCARPTEKSDVLCKRADTLCELERGMLALRSIDAALKDAPDNPSYHYVRGRALGLLGELQNAKKAMGRVLQLAPRHHAAQRALQEIDDALAERPLAIRSWARPPSPEAIDG